MCSGSTVYVSTVCSELSSVQYFERKALLCMKKQLCLDFKDAWREHEMANQFSTQSHMSSHICLSVQERDREREKEKDSESIIASVHFIAFILLIFYSCINRLFLL